MQDAQLLAERKKTLSSVICCSHFDSKILARSPDRTLESGMKCTRQMHVSEEAYLHNTADAVQTSKQSHCVHKLEPYATSLLNIIILPIPTHRFAFSCESCGMALSSGEFLASEIYTLLQSIGYG